MDCLGFVLCYKSWPLSDTKLFWQPTLYFTENVFNIPKKATTVLYHLRYNTLRDLNILLFESELTLNTIELVLNWGSFGKWLEVKFSTKLFHLQLFQTVIRDKLLKVFRYCDCNYRNADIQGHEMCAESTRWNNLAAIISQLIYALVINIDILIQL